MIKFYPLIGMLQALCLYHAYTTKSEQKWFWTIIFFPIIGCIFYLYHQFYSRRNLVLVKEEVKGTFVKNYTISKLEKNLKFSNTFANKIELANEYNRIGEHERALELYESSREGIHENDPALLIHLI